MFVYMTAKKQKSIGLLRPKVICNCNNSEDILLLFSTDPWLREICNEMCATNLQQAEKIFRALVLRMLSRKRNQENLNVNIIYLAVVFSFDAFFEMLPLLWKPNETDTLMVQEYLKVCLFSGYFIEAEEEDSYNSQYQ